MKKKLLATATVLMMMAAPAMAQVFLDDDDLQGNTRAGEGTSQLLVDNPAIYNSGEDWYVPVGEGIMVLAGLAGAYLLGKRKNEE